MDNRILSQTNTTKKEEKEEPQQTFTFRLNLEIPLRMGSLDDMTVQLRDSVMPKLAEQFSTYMNTFDQCLNALPEIKEDGYRVKERNVERSYTTAVGEVRFSRTYFRAPDGGYVYLLDKIMEIEPRERVSKAVSAELINNSVSMSFRKAIESTGVDVSSQTLHNRICALGELVVDVPETKEPAKELHIFADEDHVSIHTPNGKRNTVVPLVAITEGIDTTNPKRHQVKNPLYIAGYRQSPDTIFNQLYAVADRRYDLSEAEKIYVHADGGKWIKGYREVFPDATFVMDEFHITKRFKALSSFFTPEGLKALMGCIKKNDYPEFIGRMIEAVNREKDSRRKQRLKEELQYFMRNWTGIVNRKTLAVCGSCTEPMISHVLAERLSRTPCGWSVAGLEKMSMLRAFMANGGMVKREDVVTSVNKKGEEEALERRKKEGYEKYGKYAEKAEAALEKEIKEMFSKGLPDYIIDGTGGVQQYIKRVSSQELGI